MAESSILVRVSFLVTCAVVAVGLCVTPASSADGFPGARSVRAGHVRVQRSADEVRPAPLAAYDDKGKMYADGCQLQAGQTKPQPKQCVYGDRNSDTIVVLVGDSTAMHHFPALEPIAEERGWRLIGLTKAGCSLALYERQADCAEWQENMFRWIANRQPSMVITGGRPTSDKVSPAAVENGWVKAFRRLKDTGAKVVLMAAGPEPSVDVPRCVKRHLDRLFRCATPTDEALGYPHTDIRAARRVQGVSFVDERRLLCNASVCPVVLGNVLIYRTTYHFTRTWMKTMTGHVDARLPFP